MRHYLTPEMQQARDKQAKRVAIKRKNRQDRDETIVHLRTIGYTQSQIAEALKLDLAFVKRRLLANGFRENFPPHTVALRQRAEQKALDVLRMHQEGKPFPDIATTLGISKQRVRTILWEWFGEEAHTPLTKNEQREIALYAQYNTIEQTRKHFARHANTIRYCCSVHGLPYPVKMAPTLPHTRDRAEAMFNRVKAGRSQKRIAKAFKVSPSHVSKLLHEFGYLTTTKKYSPPPSEEAKQEMVALSLTGMYQAQIAEQFGVSQSCVSRVLKEYFMVYKVVEEPE